MVPEIPTGEVIHYIPHQPVIRDQAESTKMRIVNDCSAKAISQVPSLNDCLEVGPLLQLACSRLRDGGGKSFSNKKCEKRAGAGRHRPLSQVVRVLFSFCSF